MKKIVGFFVFLLLFTLGGRFLAITYSATEEYNLKQDILAIVENPADKKELENKYFLLLNFWETWCLPCKMEMAELSKIKELRKPTKGVDNVAYWGVTRSDTAKVTKFLTEVEFNYSIVRNNFLQHYIVEVINKKRTNKINANAIPLTVLVNLKTNKIEYVVSGYATEELKKLAQIMKTLNELC